GAGRALGGAAPLPAGRAPLPLRPKERYRCRPPLSRLRTGGAAPLPRPEQRLQPGSPHGGQSGGGDEHGAVPGQLALRLLAERDGGAHLRLLHHHRLQGAQRARQHRRVPGHAALNQVVLWDKIILRGDNPRLFLKDMKSKYFFFDDGNGLKGNRNVTLTLSWNVVPNAGLLPLVTGSGHMSVPFPDTYETTKSY
uniref:Signal peptidase complex subunit 3 n=2 Tax=Phasianidae TaxID=9005 RepID=A0A8V0XGH1_CHICK